MMKDVVKLFRGFADETRLRILHLLALEELSATEIGTILNLGQSRVSTQLGPLREAVALRERRDGRRVFLSLDRDDPRTRSFYELLEPMIANSEVCRADRENLEEALKVRHGDEDFDAAALGDLGANYLPGRTWEGLARALLTMQPAQRILDVGVGDGELTLLFARPGVVLTAVDPCPSARERLLKKARRRNLDIDVRDGAVESLPFEDATLDLVVVSQVLHHAERPAIGLAECARVLAPKGRILILDLKRHGETWVRERLEDRWLGFEESELRTWLEAAGLNDIVVHPVSRDVKPPHFVTLLATASKKELVL